MTSAILPVAQSVPDSGLAPDRIAKAWQTAKDFEAMALGQLLQPMFATVNSSRGAFGGGSAEEAWQPMLVDAIARQMAQRGDVGLTSTVFAHLLRIQESRTGREAEGMPE